jgi:hypothetical protein
MRPPSSKISTVLDCNNSLNVNAHVAVYVHVHVFAVSKRLYIGLSHFLQSYVWV